MKAIYRVYGGIMFLAFPLVYGQADDLQGRLLSKPGMEHAAVGISVRRVSDGSDVMHYNEQVAYVPASLTKLIPTYYALKTYGTGFRFKTRVVYSGKIVDGVLHGNVMIDAGGDPCLDSRYFPSHSLLDRLTAALKKAGVRQIEGKVIVNGADQRQSVPGSWPWEDISNYYAAQPGRFNYRDNAYSLIFKTGEAGSAATLSEVVPAQNSVDIQSRVTAAVSQEDNAWIFGGPYGGKLRVEGTLPQRRSSFVIRGAMADPAQSFVEEVTVRFKDHGIGILGKDLADGDVKGQALLTMESPALLEIVSRTNKASVNLFSMALGALAFGKRDVSAQVCKMLQQDGIDPGGVILKDACGLSPKNAVPAGVFTQLLICACRDMGDTFVNTLPVAGVDAALNGYYANNAFLKGNLKAKTGSMSGTRTLAGYMTTKGGELMAFTIMVNNYTCTSTQLYGAVRELLLALAER